jgi:hypothetical protein
MNRDVHADHASCGSAAGASRILTCLVSSVKRLLNVPSDERPGERLVVR